MKILFIIFMFCLFGCTLSCVIEEGTLVIGFEAKDIVLSKLDNIAGEIAFKINPEIQFRFTCMKVLQQSESFCLKDVTDTKFKDEMDGSLHGYELHVDRFLNDNFYLDFNIGYFAKERKEDICKKTITLGSGCGYRMDNLMNISKLYMNLNLPVRYMIDDISYNQQDLTKALSLPVIFNFWIFIGYNF